MNRGQPTVSKLLNKKWNEKQHEIHQRKLREMKPVYNITAPTEHKHLQTKPKRVQMLEGRHSIFLSLTPALTYIR
jgi:hypothetical protein